jgi:hypothetical protein
VRGGRKRGREGREGRGENKRRGSYPCATTVAPCSTELRFSIAFYNRDTATQNETMR